MALYYHTSLFIATVHKWQVPGQKRILNAEATGDSYLLNTNSLDGIRDRSTLPIAKSSLYYFDNPFDYRCNSHYMETDHSLAQLIAHMDLAMTHQHISLNIFPLDDPTATVVAHVFKVADIAYARAVPDSYYATHSYIWIREDLGFKVVRYRVEHTLAAILALVA
jgi:hypothetical protein